MSSSPTPGLSSGAPWPAPTATRRVTPLLLFQQRPLIRLSGGSVLPHSYRLLMEKASTGAYWVLHEHYRQQSATGLESFTKFMGALHQGYVTDLARPNQSATAAPASVLR